MSKLIKSRGYLICIDPKDPHVLCYSENGTYWKCLHRFPEDRIVDIINDEGDLLALTSEGELLISDNGTYWKCLFRF